MKVLMVGPYPEPGCAVAGGVARAVDAILAPLADLVELELVVPNASISCATEVRGVPITYYKACALPGGLRYWLTEARIVQRHVACARPDIVHVQGAAGWGRLVRAPRVVTVHGIAHQDIIRAAKGRIGRLCRSGLAVLVERIERRCLVESGNVIAVSPYSLGAYALQGVIAAHDVPNPLDDMFMRGVLPEGDRPRHLLVVGRVCEAKNTRHTLQVLERVMRMDATVRCTVLGQADDPTYLQACRNVMVSSGMGDRADFVGNVGAEMLRDSMMRASLLVSTSLQENAPMVIAEANSCGVPCLAMPVGGVPSMIHEGRNGSLFKGGGLASLAQQVCEVLDREWDRSCMADVARKRHAPRRIAKCLMDVYTGILGQET